MTGLHAFTDTSGHSDKRTGWLSEVLHILFFQVSHLTYRASVSTRALATIMDQTAYFLF